MKVEEGDRYREKLTGLPWRVTKVKNRIIILEAEGIPNRFYAADRLLDLFFERMKNQKRRSG